MRRSTIRHYLVLSAAMLLSVWCEAKDNYTRDGYEPIPVKEATVQSSPKGSAIQVYLNGNLLVVTFSENMGQVSVEVSTTSGASVQYLSVLTPNGLQIYIPNAGNYIVTFTLSNGDVYAGEFTVTD